MKKLKKKKQGMNTEYDFRYFFHTYMDINFTW